MSTPLYSTDHASVYQHRNDLAIDNASFIVTEKAGQEMESCRAFMTCGNYDAIRDVFLQAATLQGDGKGSFILFHIVNPDSDVNHLNAKLPTTHLHTFTKDFKDEYNHITDPNIKSYAVTPNANLGQTLTDITTSHDGLIQTSLDKTEREAEKHTVLMHTGFACFQDFVADASDTQWKGFIDTLNAQTADFIDGDNGGCRVVIDDRYKQANCMAVHMLGGENLDRSGANKQRWFEKPMDISL